MTIFINSIINIADSKCIIRQLEECEKVGIVRVGLFDKNKLGYNSKSINIEEAISIVKNLFL